MTTERDGRATLAWRVCRGLLLATGGVVLAVGLAVVFAPEAERLLPMAAAIRLLGSDYVVVAVVGVLAVGLAGVIVAARHVRGVHEVNPPVVEGVQSASYPGTDFDRAAESRRGIRNGASADDCRDRLGEAAIRATMRADDCPRSVAERRVTRGEWTDDPVAVRYLRDPSHADGGGTGATNGSGRAVRRTVDTIVGLSDDGTGGETGDRQRTTEEGR